jgi:uncharacterized protein YciI
MLFMVKAEHLDAGPMMPPEALVQYVEQVVIPSVEMLAQWEQEGRIRAGGAFPGERSGAFVMEADSAEEAGQLLGSLPFWGTIKWETRALQSLSSTVERERSILEQTRAALGLDGT